MVRGRPPKPLEEKRRLGNPGKRPLPASLAAVPPLSAEAWELEPDEALERVLVAGVRWIAETDAPAVAVLRKALQTLKAAELAGSIRDQIEAQKHVLAALHQLGFDPTSRARLGLAEVSAVSKLEAMRARSQTRLSDKGDGG